MMRHVHRSSCCPTFLTYNVRWNEMFCLNPGLPARNSVGFPTNAEQSILKVTRATAPEGFVSRLHKSQHLHFPLTSYPHWILLLTRRYARGRTRLNRATHLSDSRSPYNLNESRSSRFSLLVDNLRTSYSGRFCCNWILKNVRSSLKFYNQRHKPPG